LHPQINQLDSQILKDQGLRVQRIQKFPLKEV